MRINIKSTNVTLDDEIRSYLDKRLLGIDKFLPAGEDSYIADVELAKTTRHHHAGEIFKAEINVHIGGKSFRAVSEREDLRSAIDDMKDEIARELGSNKEKRFALIKRGGQKLKDLMRKFYR